MRTADPRLLRHARAARGYLVTAVAAGLAGTALILAQAGLLARALTRDLLAVTAGRATLLITHELGGLVQVDEIVVLDRGRVAERGTHRELMRAGGWYRARHG